MHFMADGIRGTTGISDGMTRGAMVDTDGIHTTGTAAGTTRGMAGTAGTTLGDGTPTSDTAVVTTVGTARTIVATTDGTAQAEVGPSPVADLVPEP
jgi:hypothetical protein